MAAGLGRSLRATHHVLRNISLQGTLALVTQGPSPVETGYLPTSPPRPAATGGRLSLHGLSLSLLNA